MRCTEREGFECGSCIGSVRFTAGLSVTPLDKPDPLPRLVAAMYWESLSQSHLGNQRSRSLNANIAVTAPSTGPQLLLGESTSSPQVELNLTLGSAKKFFCLMNTVGSVACLTCRSNMMATKGAPQKLIEMECRGTNAPTREIRGGSYNCKNFPKQDTSTKLQCSNCGCRPNT